MQTTNSANAMINANAPPIAPPTIAPLVAASTLAIVSVSLTDDVVGTVSDDVEVVADNVLDEIVADVLDDVEVVVDDVDDVANEGDVADDNVIAVGINVVGGSV